MRPAPSREWPILLCLFAVLWLAVGFDVFRVGFFADDFHLLDVARRLPLRDLMSGQYGIWPWYRPLSRELFFRALVSAGRFELVLGHVLSLSCLTAIAFFLWRIARQLVGPRSAAISVLLFLTYTSTKYVVAWASTFQDLLSLTLVMGAAWAGLERRYSLAIASAFLASFAKETGFLAFPLIACCVLILERRLPDRRMLLGTIAAMGLALCVHVVVRLGWHAPGTTSPDSSFHESLPRVVAQAVSGFVSVRPNATAATWLVASMTAAAAMGALTLVRSRSGTRIEEQLDADRRRPIEFICIATLLGAAPATIGHLITLTIAHTYHYFPATPWLALLIATQIARLRGGIWLFGVPALVGWNVLGLGFARPNLEHRDAWSGERWTWQEAVRLTAVSRRLADDVRRELQERPDSAIVLYEGLPSGSLFQTEDGPATREVLGDPSVRAFWINEPGIDLPGSKVMILSFDASTLHLARKQWSTQTAIQRAMNAVMAARGRAAMVFADYGDSGHVAVFDRAYLRAAGRLIESGPSAYLAELRAAGLADTAGEAPEFLASPLRAMAPELSGAFANVLHNPSTAQAHVTLANALIARGVLPRAGVELRIAVTLDPGRWNQRYRLAGILLSLGGTSEAIAELQRVADSPDAGESRALAREALTALARADAHRHSSADSLPER